MAFPLSPDSSNLKCQMCHSGHGAVGPFGAQAGSEVRDVSVDFMRFEESVHGERRCLECHTDIIQLPHRKDVRRTVDCVSCHTRLAEENGAKTAHVVRAINHYKASIHAQDSMFKPGQPNARCVDCHDAHYTFKANNPQGQAWRLKTPETCGRCHGSKLEAWQESVHGLARGKDNSKNTALCVDCHTGHDIASTKSAQTRLDVTEKCGNCHKVEFDSYRQTYHGQVAALGYAHTAKCFDCHDPHKTRKDEDPRSKVHADNRLETCKTCHKEAQAGFEKFYAHGNTHDLEKYPYMWIASKLMILLLGAVFSFFWAHSALWFYREWKDRNEGKSHVLMNGHEAVKRPEKQVHVRRFSWQWRLAHLVLALAVMGLVLSGTSVLYAESFWAPYAIKLMGGAMSAQVIHRTCASVFAVIFFGHILYALVNTLIVKRKSFQWFGPDSLLPRWQDFRDFWAMGNWFFGHGPRPVFDHWTYFEKFDYWAPFWGMLVIGCSGLMLWFPEVTATYLPGWVFNVATIIHGEEAFLAAVFLFTVHYFNCHWRPDKMPQDIVMFTGTMTLEEFKHERKTEYDRLVANGALENYLVDPPSRAMTLGSKILGMTLIIVGVILLLLVLEGFWEGVLS